VLDLTNAKIIDATTIMQRDIVDEDRIQTSADILKNVFFNKTCDTINDQLSNAYQEWEKKDAKVCTSKESSNPPSKRLLPLPLQPEFTNINTVPTLPTTPKSVFCSLANGDNRFFKELSESY
jgi:hypothetical protein